ncbi:unnamed protein product [Trichogramma brassicae]|uniref:Reverse transcriptase domain-containing protein n=1 Tax=Trichogramma brassicae TaxID=86971 RepID=A0A6H5I3K8_9HYME|nr:unnamed protein product [Trichogramma brassicae]
MLDPDLIARENINVNRHIDVDNQNYARRGNLPIAPVNNEVANRPDPSDHRPSNRNDNPNDRDLLNRPDVSLEDVLNEELPDGESTLSQDEIIMDDHPKQVKIAKNLLNNDKGCPDLAVPSTSHGARDNILRPDCVPSSQPLSHGVELNDELDLGLSLTQAGSGLARGINEEFFSSAPLPVDHTYQINLRRPKQPIKRKSTTSVSLSESKKLQIHGMNSPTRLRSSLYEKGSVDFGRAGPRCALGSNRSISSARSANARHTCPAAQFNSHSYTAMHANTRARALMPRTEHTCTRLRREMADATCRDEIRQVAPIRRVRGENEKRRRSTECAMKRETAPIRYTTSANSRTEPIHARCSFHDRDRATAAGGHEATQHASVCDNARQHSTSASANKMASPDDLMRHDTLRSCRGFQTHTITQTHTLENKITTKIRSTNNQVPYQSPSGKQTILSHPVTSNNDSNSSSSNGSNNSNKNHTNLGQMRSINKGLPQGSVLSPILYSIYTRSIDNRIDKKIKILQFADDIVMYLRGKHVDSTLQQLEVAANAMNRNLKSKGLEIAPEKCQLCSFSNADTTVARRRRGSVPGEFRCGTRRSSAAVTPSALSSVDLAFRCQLGRMVLTPFRAPPTPRTVRDSLKNSPLGRNTHYLLGRRGGTSSSTRFHIRHHLNGAVISILFTTGKTIIFYAPYLTDPIRLHRPPQMGFLSLEASRRRVIFIQPTNNLSSAIQKHYSATRYGHSGSRRYGLHSLEQAVLSFIQTTNPLQSAISQLFGYQISTLLLCQPALVLPGKSRRFLFI